MGTSGLLPLIVRTTISLGVVLALIGVAYAVVRRRTAPGTVGARRRAAPPAIEVVGRAGLARGTTAVALRFGDRVVMVGVAESGGTRVLAEIDGDRWDELHPVAETRVPTAVAERDGITSASVPGVTRSGFFDALRDATSRRA